MEIQINSPSIAVVCVQRSGGPDLESLWRGALQGLGVTTAFTVQDVPSLVLGYRQGLDEIQVSKADILLFVSQPPAIDVARRASFESFLSAFWTNPRMACASFVPQTGRLSRQQPLSFCGRIDLGGFMVKAVALDTTGFLAADFKYDVGAAEDFVYRQLRAGFLPGCSTESFSLPNEQGAIREDEKIAYEFAARFFVETFGRDWDLVLSSFLPFDLQRDNHFSACRKAWEGWLTDHEQALYRRTIQPDTAYLVLGEDGFATRMHGIVRLLTATAAADLLHPWYYYLTLDGSPIIPGINGLEPADALDDRKRFMAQMLTDGVLERFDFQGKSVLDAGANCGFFSAIYAEHGAANVVAVEGRLQHVHQGQLYWGVNEFVAGGHYEFLHGNIDASTTWRALDERGDFDLILCAGLLYHLPDPLATLRKLAVRAKEAIVVDTRVDAGGKQVTERGGCSFDAIVQTREKISPRLEDLHSLLEGEGFVVENITAMGEVQGRVPLVDDYGKGNRVTLFARRAG